MISRKISIYVLKLLFINHFLMSFDAVSADLLSIPLEDVVRRAHYIGVLDVTLLDEENGNSCQGIIVGKDLASGKTMNIVLPSVADVKNVGRYFAVLREVQVSISDYRKRCFAENLPIFTSSAAYQTIFPFGNGVTVPDDVILFRRASIFSSTKSVPESELVKEFYVEPDGIYGSVDFKSLVRHLCSTVFDSEVSNAISSICQSNKD